MASSVATDAGWVLTGDWRGDVQLWDLSSHSELQRAMHGDRYVQNGALSANGARAAAVSFDGSLRVWTTGAPRSPAVCQSSAASQPKRVWSGDGTRAAVVEGKVVSVCNLTLGRVTARISPAFEPVSIALSSNGKWLAMDDPYAVAAVWDTDSGREHARIGVRVEDFGGLLGSIEVSADGSRVALGGEFSMAAVLDVRSGSILFTARGSASVIPSRGFATFCLSTDGRRLVIGDESGFVDVWDVAAGSVVGRLDLGSTVSACSFGPSDEYIATATADGALRVWQLNNLAEVARIRLGPAIQSIGFTDAGDVVVTDASGRRSEHIWQTQRLIEDVCSRLYINLSPGKWRQQFGTEPYRATCPHLPVPDETRRADSRG